ncbi:LacI family DNA-binding transcriptional regulator [Shouchella lehensis]|uniref:LacI family transcription regulator n=2 Tax=Shouchella lehensis TaxID=300825 RepID=A0A060LW03_9BACI|nr:LacI family DNA-binding transcriptional regulator [Shouchella lehensis]AIC93970.1 LacI family transcription regulator [Shouchella lehensis G1]MBG9785566.1 LacI family transcriptional regulator [Shouchella lehensis]RQW19821.1 LacI family transcriptional regulator [Bacillus sp. C1-1]TES48008.1 LacI family transcriptional regulator [Shouchella lehensis]
MSTIKDVATKAGVSRSTVSRVLNHHPYVDEKKRKAVQEAIKELGYTPNSSAQRLRGTETKTIAVLVSRIVNPFFSAVVDAMDEVATMHSYRMILCNTRGRADQELHFLELLRTKQVDGVILASIVNDWETIYPYLQYGPIVLCNEYPRDLHGAPVITIDQKKAMTTITKHLLHKGYDSIAYCNVYDVNHLPEGVRSPLAEDRYEGFVQTMKSEGKVIQSSWRFSGHSVDDGRDILRTILGLSNRPNAIITGSDEIAAGIIAEAKVKKVRIPEDLAVVGFDNQPTATLLEPQLTTIHQPTFEMGKQAMEMLLTLLANQNEQYESVTFLEAPIQIRHST